MRRSILVLLAALALGAPPPGLADTASDDAVRLVTEQLRQRDGQEPTDEILVEELNSNAAALFEKGQYAEAEQIARGALERGERALGGRASPDPP